MKRWHVMYNTNSDELEIVGGNKADLENGARRQGCYLVYVGIL